MIIFFVSVHVPAISDLYLLLSINRLWMILTWFDIARQPVGEGLDLGGVIGHQRERAVPLWSSFASLPKLAAWSSVWGEQSTEQGWAIPGV